MTPQQSLRILAWDHPRATRPLAACAAEWHRRTGIRVEVTTRTLGAFGDEVPDDVTADIVLIDHPHIGQAAESGAILPLNELLPTASIARLTRDAVGASQSTYEYQGRCWALAVDASCQALAFNLDAAAGAAVPTTWDQVLALAESMAGGVGLPMHPAHAISALLSVLAGQGYSAGGEELAPMDVLTESVALLARLTETADPDCFTWEPPDILDRLARGDLACVPLVYAYVGYEVEWGPAPAFVVGGTPGSILGGVGAAVLAGSADAERAAGLVNWLAESTTQRDLILRNQGQPADRSAWIEPSSDPMLARVLSTIERAKARPNSPWWPGFQLSAGELLHDGLLARSDPGKLANKVSNSYKSHREDAR